MKFINDNQRKAVFAHLGCERFHTSEKCDTIAKLNKFAISPTMVEGYTGSKIYTDPYGSGTTGIIMDNIPVATVKDTAILAGEGYKLSPTREDVIRTRNEELLAGMPVYSIPAQKELIPGGYASGRPDSDFDPEQLAMGIEVEKEHVIKFTDKGNVKKFKDTDLAKAKEIAKDHLAEIPDYYTRLEAMEEGSKEDGVYIDVVESKKSSSFSNLSKDEINYIAGAGRSFMPSNETLAIGRRMDSEEFSRSSKIDPEKAYIESLGPDNLSSFDFGPKLDDIFKAHMLSEYHRTI